jgi:DNA-binding beta-propeller fold protein YncE
MKPCSPRKSPRRIAGAAAVLLALATGAASILLGSCGPFTDVAADVFCPFVLEIFYLGITTGTTATTYDPASNVSRLQMAAFLSRTVDGVLKRGSRRAKLDQFFTPATTNAVSVVTIGTDPKGLRSDGADLWVAGNSAGTVTRVRASDGKILETWSSALSAWGVVVATGKVFVSGEASPGRLYQIDPTQTAGAVTILASNLGNAPIGIAFDGARIWTANNSGASVSIVTPGAAIPWTVTTAASGFTNPWGLEFDGSNVWVADAGAGRVFELDANGAILQTVTVGLSPRYLVFDGSNMWAPNTGDNTISVFRVSNGTVLQTLTGNGMSQPQGPAFDGERILVANSGNDSVSLWKAADLAPLGNFPTGPAAPIYSASDGIHFWVSLANNVLVARF